MAREAKSTHSNDANKHFLNISESFSHYWRESLDFIDSPLIIISQNNYQVSFINRAANALLGLTEVLKPETKIDSCIHIRHSTTQQPLSLEQALMNAGSSLEIINRDAELIPDNGESSRVKFNSIFLNLPPGFILLSFCKPEFSHSPITNMNNLSSIDSLTGLQTRGNFEAALQKGLELSVEENINHVSGKIKIAHLSTINELCGSVAGDELLRQITQINLSSMSHKDSLYRLTGSEFGFLLRDINIDNAVEKINHILQQIKAHEFQWGGKPLPVSVNVGLTTITSKTDNWLSLMGEMDAACQAAVVEADNYYKIFSTDDQRISQTHSEMSLISTIISALQKDRLVLYVQKIVPVSKHNDIPHIEILVRMYDENDQLLSPGLFLGAAETYNLILMIDKWVVKNTLLWLEENQSWLDPKLVCNINLSGFSIGQKSFKDYLLKVIKNTVVKASQFCFEITETAAVKDFAKASDFINEVRKTGATFALDDFGSGMSSFAYLKNLQVDVLKIDGTLIRQLDLDSFDKVMVQSIAQIARVMGLTTVAEFVENEEILKQLEFLGVDYAQGFHLSKPMPLEEYKQLEIATNKN